MRIIKGVRAGHIVTLACFCNDWVLTEEFPAEPFSPLMVRIESPLEWDQFVHDPNPGAFWNLYELQDDGTFLTKGRVKV